MPDFEEIYRLYFADVYRYALALSRDEQTAEEVTQAAFVKALTAIDSFRGECRLRVWLCQIARNQYLSLCREQKRFVGLAGEAGDGGIEEEFGCMSRKISRYAGIPASPTRRCSPCGPSGSCPSARSESCSERRRAGPG